MLNEETVAANARFFQNDRSQVPTKANIFPFWHFHQCIFVQAVTVGVGTIMEAREVLFQFILPESSFAGADAGERHAEGGGTSECH